MASMRWKLWEWKWKVLSYDMEYVDEQITMYCFNKWLLVKEFCDLIWISPATLNVWRRKWRISVMWLRRVKKAVDIDFRQLKRVDE